MSLTLCKVTEWGCFGSVCQVVRVCVVRTSLLHDISTTAFLSVGYFVSSGILSLLPCGFLTSTCFKIPCRTLSKNVRPGGVTADTRCVPQLIGIAAHSGFSAFSKLPVPCHWYQPVVLNHG